MKNLQRIFDTMDEDQFTEYFKENIESISLRSGNICLLDNICIHSVDSTNCYIDSQQLGVNLAEVIDTIFCELKYKVKKLKYSNILEDLEYNIPLFEEAYNDLLKLDDDDLMIACRYNEKLHTNDEICKYINEMLIDEFEIMDIEYTDTDLVTIKNNDFFLQDADLKRYKSGFIFYQYTL